jgi:hypothetical protein
LTQEVIAGLVKRITFPQFPNKFPPTLALDRFCGSLRPRQS